jgi:hypothetical protein
MHTSLQDVKSFYKILFLFEILYGLFTYGSKTTEFFIRIWSLLEKFVPSNTTEPKDQIC